MEAGKLTKQLTIEREITRDNSVGEPVTAAWKAEAIVLGGIHSDGSKEVYRARQVRADTTHVIELRYTPILTTQKRISYTPSGASSPRIFNITGINNVGERNRQLLVSAVEIANG